MHPDDRQAPRRLGSRWVGILHGRLERRRAYREEVAWLVREGGLGLAA